MKPRLSTLVAILLFGLLSSLSRIQAQVSNLSLYFPFTEPSFSYQFTHFSVPLTASAGWRVGGPLGPAASEADLINALSKLQGLRIQMTGAAWYWVDNVNFAGLASSVFDRCNDEGWTIPGFGAAACNSFIGNPPGSINNGFAPPVFVAPARFVGDMSSAYGGVFSFDM